MHIIVVTPEHPFLEQDCTSVTLPGEWGEMQILTGHATMLSGLKAGMVTVKNQNQEICFTIDHGYAEVSCDRINLLCEQAKFVRDEEGQKRPSTDI